MRLFLPSSPKRFCRIPILLLVALFLLQGCGYHHPAREGDENQQVKIAIVNWRNQTGVLGLESDLLQTLIGWFSKGGIMQLSDPGEAECFLEGTLLSLHSPGQSFSSTDQATQLQARLRLSYLLKDTAGGIIIEEQSLSRTATYPVGSDAIRTEDNRRKALAKILNDISEDIYLQILVLYDVGEKL